MVKKSPQEIRSVLAKLPADSDAILIGGHAINLWATAYQDKIPELQDYLPFSSEDLDFIGGKIEAVEFQKLLGGKLSFPESFSPSPNTAILMTEAGSDSLRIDFLTGAYGLDSEQVDTSAILFESKKLAGVNIRVINPILCLTGKLKAYTGLPQYGRQDRKHLKIAILIARQYIKEVCLKKQPRSGLKLIERLAKTAKSEIGLRVWQQDRIDIIKAIPDETLSSFTDEQWQKFKNIRLPQLRTEIIDKRQKYQQIEANRTARQENIKQKKEFER